MEQPQQQQQQPQQQEDMNITVNPSDGNEPQSARMLVVLQSGEKRLITFTLPKESCTVQELLEQVCVQLVSKISVKEIKSSKRYHCCNFFEFFRPMFHFLPIPIYNVSTI